MLPISISGFAEGDLGQSTMGTYVAPLCKSKCVNLKLCVTMIIHSLWICLANIHIVFACVFFFVMAFSEHATSQAMVSFSWRHGLLSATSLGWSHSRSQVASIHRFHRGQREVAAVGFERRQGGRAGELERTGASPVNSCSAVRSQASDAPKIWIDFVLQMVLIDR